MAIDSDSSSGKSGMTELALLTVFVHGRVQGVYFRVFTQQQGRALGLVGYARNLPGGRVVEVVAEGSIDKLEELVQRLRVGPSGAKVEKVETQWGQATGHLTDFDVRY